MDRPELAQLEGLWHTLGKVGTTQENGDIVISEPFSHFPARTPVLDIWAWFEVQNRGFSVARQLYGTPVCRASSL